MAFDILSIKEDEQETKIDDAFIEKWHPRYDEFAHDEEEYNAIIRRLSRELRDRGRISEETFIRILDWKAPRVKGIIRLDALDLYAEAVNDVLLAPDEKKLDILLSLPGIGVPVASTILHFLYPERFPIMDVRTTEVLYFAAKLIKSKQRDLNHYAPFRVAIMNIHQQCPRWSLREIDRSLVAYHKLELEPKLRKITKPLNHLGEEKEEVAPLDKEKYLVAIERFKRRIFPRGYEDFTDTPKKLYETVKEMVGSDKNRLFRRKEIGEKFRSKFGIKMQIQPTDFCFNKINVGPDFETKFLLATDRGEFRFVDFYWVSETQQVVTWKIKELNKTFKVGYYQGGRFFWNFPKELMEELQDNEMANNA